MRRLWFAVLALVLTACMPTSSIGFTLRGDEIVVLLNLCDGEQLGELELMDADNGTPVLWAIETTDPRDVREVVIGQVPEGFTETVPLTTDVFSSERIWIDTFRNSELISSGVVPVSDLAEGEVWLDGETFTTEQYAELNCAY